MIKKDKVQRGKIDDEFVRMYTNGKIMNDILQNKVLVQLESIFTGLENTRKVVLIEGAPGSGKSTLSINICQKWEEGKLFNEYSAVILIRLHDPLVHKATNVKNLLPYTGDLHDNTTCNEVAIEIEATFGKNVLWILDGYDELPTDIPDYSIIKQLLQSDSPLFESSVIVTSRPIGSVKLHQLVSSRFEIIGFTQSERREYFKECLKEETKPESALKILLEQIEENPIVEASCYLPLYAAIIVHLYLVGGESLPTTVHGIFTRIVRCILARYYQRNFSSANLESLDLLGKLPEEIHEPFHMLCKLAYKGLMENRITFTSEDFEVIGSSHELDKLGLLQAHSTFDYERTITYFCFLHYSIQELLAAIHLCHMSPSKQISIFKCSFSQPTLSTLFQFYAGITKLTIRRSVVGRMPPILRFGPGDLLDVVKKIIKKENDKFTESKPLLVSLIHCLYEAQDVLLCKFVAETLSEKLDLSHSILTPANCLSIGYFLSCVCTSISKLFFANLTSCSIDDQCCKFLIRGLCKRLTPDNRVYSIIEMDLAYNNITDDGTELIANVLCNLGVFCKLSLGSHMPDTRYNCINIQGLNSLSNSLLNNSSLTELNLSGCMVKITEDNGEVLRNMLYSNKTLKVLTLSYNHNIISNHGIEFIMKGLKYNTGLQVLNMSNCCITSTAIKYLSQALQTNKTLIVLNISYNKLCREDMSCLHCLLTTNNSLHELNLSNCDMSDVEIESLSEALGENRALKKLDIRGNTLITNHGMSQLIDALRKNPLHELETLLIPWNLNPSGAVEVLRPSSSNKSKRK